MRHLKKGRKFGREKDQRRALMKSLASSFFVSGRIVTTEAKAKELRPRVEKIITRAKNYTLASRRRIESELSRSAAQKVQDAAKTFMSRPGGYTRITKLGARKSDSARMAVIELVK
jgi:large subunit ribosomal protein L17